MNEKEIKQRISELDAERSRLEKELEYLNKRPTPAERLLEIFTGCTIERDEKIFPDSIFLMKGGKYFFEIKKPYLWCSYSNVWDVFAKEYGMRYNEIQSLITNVVEEHFKMKGLTPENNKNKTIMETFVTILSKVAYSIMGLITLSFICGSVW